MRTCVAYLVAYCELAMSITKLRLRLHLRMSSPLLPVEQGWLARPGVQDFYAAYLAPMVSWVMSGTAFLTA